MARSIPEDIPPEAVPFLEGMGYFAPDILKPGDRPPDIRLRPLAGGELVQIPRGSADRPTVLIFGSYT